MMAAYFFLLALRGEGGTAAFCLGGLAAGEALGTKAVGVVFVPPLVALAAAVIVWRAKGIRTRIVQLLVVLLVPLVTGGYWYFCNALLTGNPLYPLEVRMLGRSSSERVGMGRVPCSSAPITCLLLIGGR